MTIRAGDAYLVSPDAVRIDRQGWINLLSAHANPDLKKERPLGHYYDTVLAMRSSDGRVVDPLFILAMFNHESSMGKAGVATETKSWGNTRTPNFGGIEPVGMHPRGFPKWATWLDGLKTTVARLLAPTWYYAGERRTIGGVFVDPVAENPAYPYAMDPVPRRVVNGKVQYIAWAPPQDQNNPNSYLNAMLRFMNDHALEVPSVSPYPTIFPNLIDFRPSLHTNDKGGPRQKVSLAEKRAFQGLVVHFNGPEVGPDDRAHTINVSHYHAFVKDWDERAGDPHLQGDGIMYHIAVTDHGEQLLLRDLEDVLWHCGNTEWNRKAIALYLPIGGAQKVTEVQQAKAFEIIQQWEKYCGGINLRGHQEITPTSCPGTAQRDVVVQYRSGARPPVGGTTIDVPGYGRFTVNDPIYTYWLEEGGSSPHGPGLPISNTYTRDGLVVQDFERDRLEIHGSKIMAGRVNAELQQALNTIDKLEEMIDPHTKEMVEQYHRLNHHVRRMYEIVEGVDK